jgi:hypothetical protein
MKLLPLALLALLALSGCATSKLTPEQADPVPADRLYGFTQKTASDDARITVIRDGGFFGSGCTLVVYIDGKRVAEMNSGELASFYVTPGERVISTGVSGRGLCSGYVDQSVEIMAKPNQIRAYRLSFDQSGFHIGPYVSGR